MRCAKGFTPEKKFAHGARPCAFFVAVSALNNVDLPTFGSPTIPALNILISSQIYLPVKLYHDRQG